MVERVDREGFVPASGPAAYEAGTPAIAAAVAWREALALLGEAGLDRIAAQDARARDPCGTGSARRSGRHGAGGRLPAVRVARELSWWTGCIPTTSAASWTPRAWPHARGTTARSRCTARWAQPPACAPASPATPAKRTWTPWWRPWRSWPMRRRREAHGDASHGAARKDAAMNLDDEAVMERHRNPRFKGFSGPWRRRRDGRQPLLRRRAGGARRAGRGRRRAHGGARRVRRLCVLAVRRHGGPGHGTRDGHARGSTRSA